jgi:hypothetical protein
MWHAWKERENRTGFLCKSPKERNHSEDERVDGRMGSEWILRRFDRGCRFDSTGSG